MTPPAVMGFPRATAVRTAASEDAGRGLALGATVFGLTLPALILLQYALPAHADAHYWGLNPAGMLQFRAHLGLQGLPALSVDSFSLVFRLMLVALWGSYALMVLTALQGAKLTAKPILLAVIGAALIMAVVCPPLLSHDVYAYAAHGRLFALYGQNPYLARPAFLTAAGDPAAPYVTWNWPTVYGPVWTRIEIAAVSLLSTAGLWPQIVALKLVQAGALVTAALAGRRITARLCPGRENLTLLAIGLNPLLLLEGPGSGHNDLLLISLLLIGAMFVTEKNYPAAALFLGLSVGVKLVTVCVLPWAWAEYGRGLVGRKKLAGFAAAAAVIVLPLAVCFGPFWHGGAALAAMQERAFFHLSPQALAEDQQVKAWLLAHGVGSFVAKAGVTLYRDRVVIAAYGLLSLWLWRQKRPGAWLTAWAVLAAVLMFFAMGLSFPWYIAWFWPVCLLRWDRFHLSLSAACFGLSLAWEAGYGIVFQTR